jgi:DNA-binding NtrC family response regulator
MTNALSGPTLATPSEQVSVPIGTSIAEMERALIEATLARCDGNKREAAQILGVSLKTLYNRLHKYQRFPRTGRRGAA